ncbi:MAG TPA: MotA/TolQ/ExbB proton channel family protein [Kiritimatiellia bacterium]|nr:MotA/TolQ/ExbB proton channel family protein [Kiritimatiellia bacterium]
MTSIPQTGSLVLWLIAAISLLATYLFFQRLFHLHRAQIKTSDFLAGIFNILGKGNVVEAISQCDDTPGPVARMARAAILAHQRNPVHVRQAMEDVGLAEIPRLERHLSLLLSLAQIAPLAGLFGTVIGMMDVVKAIELQAPVLYAGDLSPGLQQALLTTAAGIFVAIPAYVGYNFLVSRAEAILLEMERAYAEISLYLDGHVPGEGTR